MESRRGADKTEKTAKPSLQFDKIAFLYDALMTGVPYREWIEYVEDILKHFDHHPKTVLDLCCGTGSASIFLAQKGYDVAGVDLSAPMVEVAKRKAGKKRLNIDFRAQNASSLRLGRRFDLVVSLFDSLNYILESSALQQAFQSVSAHLEPGALFIFDMNTEVALAGGMFNQSNVGSRSSSVIYDWHSSYDQASRICRVQMDFLYRSGGGEEKVEAVHYQRAYDEEEIADMLKTAGIEVLDVYDAYTFRKAAKRSDRVFFIARK